MNEPSSAQNGGGDGVPAWMKTVSEETFYNARPTEADEDTEREASVPSSPPSPEPSVDEREVEGDDDSLKKKLSVSMGTPSEIPEPDPNLQPEVVGRVRADLHRQLKKARTVLDTRYEKELSKSLLIEFALRRTLLELQEQGEESALVRWLDSVLPQS